ncbi:MAG TPA: bifunctional demethylmenaquinone methyltransferase/2-methoxy-6-polyprenyl-1,4-benzoquinol methylase UbiE [Capillibacterium sp.]
MPVSLKEQRLAAYFRKIAPRYDLVNTLVSFGLHHYWRHFAVEKADLRAGQQVLDVCCGTGLITRDLAQKVGPRGYVVGLDLSPSMLKIAAENLRELARSHRIRLVEGNAMALPFPDHSFDRAVIGYGLRNVADMRQALRELYRVLKPGGRLVGLELGKPRNPLLNKLYTLYFATFPPLVGFLMTGEKEPYLYLHRSVQAYPAPAEVSRIFGETGFTAVHYYELSWGIATVHTGEKPVGPLSAPFTTGPTTTPSDTRSTRRRER